MQKRLENPVTIVMTFLMLCAVPGRCGALRIMLSDQAQEWKDVFVTYDEGRHKENLCECLKANDVTDIHF